MSRRTKNPTVNVAIPRGEHRLMKREADVLGMKLKDYQLYVLLLARTAGPDLHRQTQDQFQAMRRSSAA